MIFFFFFFSSEMQLSEAVCMQAGTPAKSDLGMWGLFCGVFFRFVG